MRSFPKPLAGIVIALAIAGLVMSAFAQKKEDEKTGGKDKRESVKKAGKKKDAKDDKPKEPGKIDIPVSQDHDAKGLKIPYFDGDGKKQMIFTIGVASRIDEEHIAMEETQIETFDANEEHEMTIDLPKSVLNVTTSIITTKKHMEIKREDFALTGETMQFNMKTKQGTLGGGVHMVIYNLEDEIPDAPKDDKPPEPKAPK